MSAQAFAGPLEKIGDSQSLTAVARGESYDENRHELEHEVKAITYHGLKIRETESGWMAEVIVDV